MLSLRFRCVQALAKNASDPEVLARVSEAPAVVKAVIVTELVSRDLFGNGELALLAHVLRTGDSGTQLNLSTAASLTDRVVRSLKPVGVTDLDLGHVPPLSARSWRSLASAVPLLSLDLSRARSAGLLTSFATHCARLRSVKADHCATVTDAEVSLLLQRCGALQELSLRGNEQLTDRAFRGLPERSYLLALDVRCCPKLTDATLVRIAAHCPTLLSLSLEGQRFDHGVTAILNQCSALQALAIPMCRVNEEALLLVRNTSCRVRRLDLFGATFSQATLLFLFGNVFRNLVRLNLSGVRHFTLDVLRFVCLRSPRLQWLSLKGFLGTVTDEHLDVIAASLRELLSLDLGMCRAISNQGVKRVIEACPTTMRALGLVGCPAILDDTVQLLAERCGATLEKVSLGGCKLVTDASVAALARNCTRLRTVCFKCTHVESPTQLVALVRANPFLRVISLSGCKGADASVISAIRASCPEVAEVYVSGLALPKQSLLHLHSELPRCRVYGKRQRVSSTI